MAQDLFTLQGSVEVDLSRLNKGLAQAKANAQGMQKGLDEVRQSTTQVTAATNQSAAALGRAQQNMNQTRQATQGLQQSTRDLATSVLGANVGVVTLATAVGGVLVAAIMAGVRAIIESTTQFARLQNQMATVTSFMGRVGREFEFVEQQARLTGRSLEEVSQQWADLARQAESSGGNIEVARQALIQFNQALALNRQATIAGSLTQLGTSFGNLVTRVDSATGVSTLFTDAINGLGRGLNFLANLLPRPGTELERLRTGLNTVNAEIERMRAGDPGQIMGIFGMRTRTAAEAAEHLLSLERSRADNEERLIAATAADPARLEARARAMQQFNEQLAHEIGLGNMHREQQEVRNRLFQAELQFRQMGLGLSQQERAELQASIVTAQAASQIQGIRESLLTTEAAEMESFGRRMTALRTYYQGRNDLQAEYNSLLEQEFFRSQTAMLQIQLQNAQHLMQAQMGAFQALGNVLQQFGQKNKAAAVAAIGVNTALQIAQTVQNTAAAQVRALAELGPVAGPPMAASIRAFGSLQIAAIAAAGVLNGMQTMSGGSAPSGGGSTGGSTSVASPEETETQRNRVAVNITLEPAAWYSGKQVEALIKAINEDVKDGGLLISTSTLTT